MTEANAMLSYAVQLMTEEEQPQPAERRMTGMWGVGECVLSSARWLHVSV